MVPSLSYIDLGHDCMDNGFSNVIFLSLCVKLTQRARSHSPSPSPNSLTQSSEKLDVNTSSDVRFFF